MDLNLKPSVKVKEWSILSATSIALLAGATQAKPVHAAANIENLQTQAYSFTVNVNGENQKAMPNQKVELFDITSTRQKVSEQVSDAKGQSTFKLKTNHNYAFAVNGESQGYTVRSSETDAKETTFTIKGQGSVKPTYTGQPITISVVDEEANALKGQTVTLKDMQNNIIATKNTSQDGRVIFSDKILKGVFYKFEVNGKNQNDTAPEGSERTVFLDSSDIVKPKAVKDGSQTQAYSFTGTSNNIPNISAASAVVSSNSDSSISSKNENSVVPESSTKTKNIIQENDNTLKPLSSLQNNESSISDTDKGFHKNNAIIKKTAVQSKNMLPKTGSHETLNSIGLLMILISGFLVKIGYKKQKYTK